MIVNEDLVVVRKKLEESENQLARERSQKEDLMASQKDQDSSTSEKMIEFENQFRSKDTQILELTHEVERMKASNDENLEKYTTSVTELNSLKKTQQELNVKHERQTTELQEKLVDISNFEENVKELNVKHERQTTEL